MSDEKETAATLEGLRPESRGGQATGLGQPGTLGRGSASDTVAGVVAWAASRPVAASAASGSYRSVQCLGTTDPTAELQGNSADPDRRGRFRWGVVDLSTVPTLPPALEPEELALPDAVVPSVPVEPGPEWSWDPEWAADLEYVWRVRVADAMRSLQARARRRRWQARNWIPDDAPRLRVVALRSAEWADHRARSLAMTRFDVQSACGKRWRGVSCGCGTREMKVGCDQPLLCGRCRLKHCRKWRKRIVAGMDQALREERKAWWRVPRWLRRGMRPGIYLITLTAPHSGDLETDRDVLGAGVRKLLKHAAKHGWWRSYALTWEATNIKRDEATGERVDDGNGHVHCHLAVVSAWVPYTSEQAEKNDPDAWRPRRKGERARRPRGLHEVWRDAVPGAVVVDVKAPRQAAAGGDAMSAGIYLAKYVTKGIDPAEFTGRKAGELLAAFRGKRKVSTSEGFWIPKDPTCECCKQLFRSDGAPMSLQELSPSSVLRSQAVRFASKATSGPFAGRYPRLRPDEQVRLRWDGN